MFGRQKVVVFKPRLDDRYDAVEIESFEQRLVSVPVENAAQIERYIQDAEVLREVVGVDEAQFFDTALVPLLERIANAGRVLLLLGSIKIILENHLQSCQNYWPFPIT